MKTWKDLQRLISAQGGSQISMKVKRGEQLVDVTITPDLVKEMTFEDQEEELVFHLVCFHL